MDMQILEPLGQIAGIGGIAVGVLALIFRNFIAQNILGTLERREAYRVIRLIIIFTWTIALAGIGSFTYGKVYVDPHAKLVELLKPPFPTNISRFVHGPQDCLHHAYEVLCVGNFTVDESGLTCQYAVNKHNTGNCRGMVFDENRPTFHGKVTATIRIQDNKVYVEKVKDDYPQNLEQDTKAGDALVQYFKSKSGSMLP